MVKKQCTKCKIEKDFTEFNKNKRTKDGLHSQCKQCKKEYRDKNRDNISEYKKDWANKNREHKAEYQKKYREENKDKIRVYLKEWERENRKQNNIAYQRKKAFGIIRNIIRQDNPNIKSKAFKILGCDYNQLKTHLESKLQSGS